MAVATQRLTADEFLERLSEPGVQLIAGELVVTSGTPAHQFVVARLARTLEDWAEQHHPGTHAYPGLDVRLGDEDVFKPDVAWSSTPHDPFTARREELWPDLVVEVRSPSTWRFDVGRKKRLYEQSGVRELWLVDLDARSVLVFRRSRSGVPTFDAGAELFADDTIASPLLPGFTLPVSALFAR